MKQLNTNISVYLVDDDDGMRTAICQMFELDDILIKPIKDPVALSNIITPDFEGIIITDVRMPIMDGFALFKHVKSIDSDIPVIFITGHADVPMVLNTLRDGAFDFFAKPVESEHLLASARRAIGFRKLILENRNLKTLAAKAKNGNALIGETLSMRQLRDTIEQISSTGLDILIEGETGTGKNLVASTIHDLSGRSNREIISLNCAALRDNKAEEDLFGYITNPGTLSARENIGTIERAHQSTLYLDKLDGLSLDIQAQLLPVVEKREVTLINGDAPKPLSLRIIASTSTNLSTAVTQGTFQSDLLYRLNAVILYLPALRDRREDIPLLFSHFISEAAQKHNKRLPKITAATRKRLTNYDWPGNVRELKNFANSLVLGIGTINDKDTIKELSLPERVEQFEANIIRAALERTKGDSKATISALGIPRKTFYDKVSRHGIDLKSYRKQAG